MYEDPDEYLDDYANLTPAMVQSIAEMSEEDEDYEGLPGELAELAREGE